MSQPLDPVLCLNCQQLVAAGHQCVGYNLN
jgi:hypothetical protein